MKSKRIQKIVETMDQYNISPYEVSKSTSLSERGVQKIKQGLSLNPQERTLDEIEEYLKERLRNDHPNKEMALTVLAEDCVKKWDELKEIPIFKKQLELDTMKTINTELKEILRDFKK